LVDQSRAKLDLCRLVVDRAPPRGHNIHMPIAPDGVRDHDAPALESHPPSLTRAELVEVYEIWKLLGPMAAARAAATASRVQLLEAAELVALMRTEPVGPRWADYNMTFHGLIEDLGSGPRLTTILTELRGLASRYVRESVLAGSRRLDEANSEHEDILRAVMAGDAEAAAVAALHHLDNSLRGLLTVQEVRTSLRGAQASPPDPSPAVNTAPAEADHP
jgi:DNA-binding FadR family transcriptional regulator